MKKHWTNAELASLFSRQQQDGIKVVLPIIWNVSFEEVRQKYPFLQNRKFVDASGVSLGTLVKQIIDAIKVDANACIGQFTHLSVSTK